MAALATEVAILLCYADVLGRSVLIASRMRPSLEERRCSGLGPWFVFRLAITGFEAAGRAIWIRSSATNGRVPASENRFLIAEDSRGRGTL